MHLGERDHDTKEQVTWHNSCVMGADKGGYCECHCHYEVLDSGPRPLDKLIIQAGYDFWNNPELLADTSRAEGLARGILGENSPFLGDDVHITFIRVLQDMASRKTWSQRELLDAIEITPMGSSGLMRLETRRP